MSRQLAARHHKVCIHCGSLDAHDFVSFVPVVSIGRWAIETVNLDVSDRIECIELDLHLSFLRGIPVNHEKGSQVQLASLFEQQPTTDENKVHVVDHDIQRGLAVELFCGRELLNPGSPLCEG
jgi:hypothetical protein